MTNDMSCENRVVAIFFKVEALLRFLSHQETSRLLRRAIARAGINLKYSEGFNPHPKMSLPLPRSVALASECELVLVGIAPAEEKSQTKDEDISRMLSTQLPKGMSIVDVKMFDKKVKFEPKKISYFIPLDMKDPAIKNNILEAEKNLKASNEMIIERKNFKTGKKKKINLTGFIEDMSLEQEGVVLKVLMEEGTTIKLDELPMVFGITSDELGQAIVRKEIEWEIK